MSIKYLGTALAASLLTSAALPALAHATLEQTEIAVNSTYKAVMRIGHGCGDEATLKVRIAIPEGVISVKPMPKAGWTLETVIGSYEQSYEYHGTHNEGVREITWTGSLPDGHYDEFIFQARITDSIEADTTIHFPTTQICATGEQAWIEIPAEGQDPHQLKAPAPGLKVTAGAHAHH